LSSLPPYRLAAFRLFRDRAQVDDDVRDLLVVELEIGDRTRWCVVRAVPNEIVDLGVGESKHRALWTGEDGRIGRRVGAVALLPIDLERVLPLCHVSDARGPRAGAAAGTGTRRGRRARRCLRERLGGRGRQIAGTQRRGRGDAERLVDLLLA